MSVFIESDGLQNWEAVDASAAESDRKRVYLNVCHKVIQQGDTTGCPEDAAICAIGECPNIVDSPCESQSEPEELFDPSGITLMKVIISVQ